MQWLIDGYNVMHAAGWLGARIGREAFRRARRRFLDDLAAVFEPSIVEQITVIFDASAPPGDFPVEGTYRGMSVVFAVNDENADARIERLIAQHSSPKSLVVVSSDHRIRQAAARRKAKVLTADQFWDLIDREKERAATKPREKPRREGTERKPQGQPAHEESAFWQEEFRDALEAPAAQEAVSPDDSLLSDAEIREIERQINREA
jgi:predicted RNA-binding protein with PIN domain